MSVEPSASSELFNRALPDNDTQRATLARELRVAEGFTLIFAVCNSADERARQIAALREELSDLRIREVPVRSEVPHLLNVLRATLEDPIPDAVFVYGMENWIRGDSNPRSIPFLLNLNAARNHFIADCPCPLVLWIPDYLLGLIIGGAPDFASVRSGLYVFTTSITEAKDAMRTLQSLGFSETLGLPLDEKQQRLKELTELLEKVRSLPEERRNVQDEIYLLDQLAWLYITLGRYDAAEPLLKEALAIAEKTLGREHPKTTGQLNNLAQLYLYQHKYAEAEFFIKEVLTIVEKTPSPEHPSTASTMNGLAVLYDNQGRYAEAEPLYEEALSILERTLGPEHPDTQIVRENLELLRQKRGEESHS